MSTPVPRTRWSELTGDASGESYDARFAALAASGQDVHGEANLCAALVPAPARVLDAGCGTGRVAIRLQDLGYDCVGVDADESMLRVARAVRPALPWVLADLSTLDLSHWRPSDLDPSDLGRPFDLCVAAGNVIPLLAEGSLEPAVRALAAHLRTGGLLVAGFGLDAAHLPAGCPVTGLPAYDLACERAGLELAGRNDTWDWNPHDLPPEPVGTGARVRRGFTGGGYAVSVHQRL